jgi:hypothetical protein
VTTPEGDDRHPARNLRQRLGRAGDPAGFGAAAPEQPSSDAASPAWLVTERAEGRRWPRPRAALALLVAAALVAMAVHLLLPGTHPGSSPALGARRASPTAVAVPAAQRAAPFPRLDATMAYDPATRSVVLYGGLVLGTDPELTTLSDTWTWDGSAWSQAHPTTTPPSLSAPVMAYDPATQRVVLTGGDTTSGKGELVPNDTTWTWDGSDWTAQPGATLPAGVSPAALATDDATGQLLLVTTGSGCRGVQTWEWGGTVWTPLHPPASPPAATTEGMAYDRASGRLELYTAPGYCTGTAQTIPTTAPAWWWDGTAWRVGQGAVGTVMAGPWELTESAADAFLVTPDLVFT